MRHLLALLLAGALLTAGCAPKPDPGPQPPPPTPGPGASAEPTLVRDGAGYRIETGEGHLALNTWLGNNRLLIRRSSTLLLANLEAGTLTPLREAEQLYTHVSPTGDHAILVHDLYASMLNSATGNLRAVGGGCWEQSPAQSARWVSDTQAVVVMQSNPPKQQQGWGCLYLEDINGTSHLLGAGALAAALPGGRLLVQSHWVDGSLVLYAPPYSSNQPPQEVAVSGPLRSGFSLSPDSQHLVWVEYLPPLDDWALSIPGYCCGAQGPPAQEIKLWEVGTDKFTTFPASGQRFFEVPTWRRDGQSLILPARTPTLTLIQLNLDGTSSELHRGQFIHHYQVVAEAPDGSLILLTAGDERGQNWSRLFRLFPDGREEVIIEGLPVDWEVQGTALTVRRDGKTTRTDLLTGQTITADLAGTLSPDGRWVAAHYDPDTPHVIHIHPTDAK